jgi:hypothetical protein
LAVKGAKKQQHFAGKADLCRAIDTLEQAPVESKKAVAVEVAARIRPANNKIKQLCGKYHPENGTMS